ncbi:MAG: glutamate-5-semialdehyde dehydrogenase, partial [Actinomycetota bacterium]
FDVESLIPNTEFRPIAIDDLYKEWEWENEPEVSLICVDNISEALGLFNSQSPFFVLSVVSDNADDVEYCWRNSNAPFFCNGFTRWVDGQYALLKPELGLSNWQQGRTLARGGILSGDSMYTVRYRATQVDSSIKR